MIITKITGGLGNQLFQYAAGRALAEQQHTDLALDISAYKTHKKRIFGLDNFAITTREAGYWNIMLRKFFIKNSYLHGDFQSETYFKEITAVIRQEFRPKESLEAKFPDVIQKIKTTNSIFLHIRRTDYLEKQHRYIVLTPEYYDRAVKIMVEKVVDPTFFIFSDDIEWAKKNITLPTAIFVSNGAYKDYEELHMMSLCKHSITANSTFSWWGAWLNQNPLKIIITPACWFTASYVQAEDLLPESWLRI